MSINKIRGILGGLFATFLLVSLPAFVLGAIGAISLGHPSRAVLDLTVGALLAWFAVSLIRTSIRVYNKDENDTRI